MMKRLFLILAWGSWFLCTNIFGQSEEDLAKAAQNPVSDIISLPFQNNTIFGNAPHDRASNVLNIQPVIPLSVGRKMNVINRIIAPIVTKPSSILDESTTGLGDINYTAWFSPKEAGKLIYGIGPVFQLPTAGKSALGSGEFGIGPSLVALTMIDQWVAGIVLNNLWTFGDVSENKFLFQYFINYNVGMGWYVVSAPILTANWKADKGQQWIVPFGLGVGKLFRLGPLPINVNAQAYYHAERPNGVGAWGARFQLQFVFPA